MTSGLEESGRWNEDGLELSSFRKSADLGDEVVVFPAFGFGFGLLDEAENLGVDAVEVPFEVADGLRVFFAASSEDSGLVYWARTVGASSGG